jgi:prepilin-type N-terminal cleavage/methylation domain-containing protein
MRNSRSGFSLLEVLAAILLTSIFMSVFAQLFTIARGSDRIPGDLFAAVANGRELLAQSTRVAPKTNAISGGHFRDELKISKLYLIEIPDRIAPAVRSSASPQQAASGSQHELQALSIIVVDPSGRRTELDGVTSLAH